MALEQKLTLGPVLYHWPETQWRDFYFRIADEADIDVVYVGEAVCSKRAPFTLRYYDEVEDRLKAAGKEVVRSSLALVMNDREAAGVHALCTEGSTLVEANDLSAVQALKGASHVIGPFINVYNEGTAGWFAGNGATRIVLPNELAGCDVLAIAECGIGAELEVQVFGRLPLALSARCYHARAHERTRINCAFICGEDPDGMEVRTINGEPFLAVNGIQTLSQTVACLMSEMPQMIAAGVTHFRLWPQAIDMVAVARLFRQVLEGTEDPLATTQSLATLVPFAGLSNGFWHGSPGVTFTGL